MSLPIGGSGNLNLTTLQQLLQQFPQLASGFQSGAPTTGGTEVTQDMLDNALKNQLSQGMYSSGASPTAVSQPANRWGTMGQYVTPTDLATDPSLRSKYMTEDGFNWDLREQNPPEVTLNNLLYSRMFASPEELAATYQHYGLTPPAGGFTFQDDPTWGSLVPYSQAKPVFDELTKRGQDTTFDKLAFSLPALGFGAAGGFAALGGAGAAGGELAGLQASTAGLDYGAWEAANAGLAGGSLPSSYLNMLAEGGATASDAAPAAAGTFGGEGAVGGGANALEGTTGFNWGGGLAEDAVTSGAVGNMDEWITQQIMAGGGDLTSLLNTIPGMDQATITKTLADLNNSATTSTARSAVGKLLSGEASVDDYVRLIGGIGAAGLGVLGSNAQGDAYKDVANQYLQIGAPFRQRLTSSYEPGFDLTKSDPAYGAAFDTSMNSILRGLSTKGNPFDNPGGLQQAQQQFYNSTYLPTLANYRGQLGQFGGLGLNTSGQANMAGASTAGGAYDAVGYGLNQLTQPQDDLASLFRKYNLALGTGKTLGG